jgi:predicted dehydrogenase
MGLGERRMSDLRDTTAAQLAVGIVGCGNVSDDYFRSCAMYPEIEIAACADVNTDLAERKAGEYGLRRAMEPAALLADPELDLVINLTPPSVHATLNLEALDAGKHVFSEKPLAPDLATAKRILTRAKEVDRAVGSAPATFLGGGLQTCRKVIDDGWIGRPVAAVAFFTSRGYEHWHPAVDSYYSVGGGPLLDIGPYSVSALTHLLGPVTRVSGSAKRTDATRPRSLRFEGPPEVQVQVPTHAAATLDFAEGATATLIASWEIWATKLPYIEIYGTEGTLSVPNPDDFGGIPVLRRGEAGDLAQVPTEPSGGTWHELPLTHKNDVGRGIAIADMALALRHGRDFRASGEFALHTLEVLLAVERSSESGAHVNIEGTVARPEPLPPVSPGSPVRFE